MAITILEFQLLELIITRVVILQSYTDPAYNIFMLHFTCNNAYQTYHNMHVLWTIYIDRGGFQHGVYEDAIMNLMDCTYVSEKIVHYKVEEDKIIICLIYYSNVENFVEISLLTISIKYTRF